MQKNSNADVAKRWLSCMEVGDIAGLMDLLDDSGSCWFQDSLPFAGSYAKPEYRVLLSSLFETEDSFFPEGLQIPLDNVIETGENVVIEAHSIATTRAGKLYNNRYVFIFRIVDGKVALFKEYSDTAHVKEILLQS